VWCPTWCHYVGSNRPIHIKIKENSLCKKWRKKCLLYLLTSQHQYTHLVQIIRVLLSRPNPSGYISNILYLLISWAFMCALHLTHTGHHMHPALHIMHFMCILHFTCILQFILYLSLFCFCYVGFFFVFVFVLLLYCFCYSLSLLPPSLTPSLTPSLFTHSSSPLIFLRWILQLFSCTFNLENLALLK
jgi:hypothetical protein